MLAGFYTIASGMMVQQRKLEVQGNNLINSQTPGFHAQRVVASSFEEELSRRLEPGASGNIGTVHPIAIVENVSTEFDSGNLKPTDRDMDVAINGGGYFTIQGEGVTYLTRNGQFDVDQEGYLVLPNVGRIQGENGPIQVGDTSFTVMEDGTVVNSKDEEVGKLRLMLPADGVEMTQYENGIFGIPNGTQTQTVTDSTFVSGNLELSNVDYNQEYTLLIEAQRSFQACSTALQMIDGINQKAATQIASL